MTFVSAQNVNIPNFNFKTYLLGNNAINTNGDNEISVAEAQAFSGIIYCSNKNILDLTGIEAFVNITQLYCQNNQLSSLDLGNNTALEVLRCENNQLTSLDVSNNTALEVLNCSSNQLSSLDVSNNTALKQLYCQNNQLTSLNLKNGNNSNIHYWGGEYYIDFRGNPNLSCIQVDNVSYNNSLPWLAKKDATACYSDNCVTPTFNIPTSVCQNATVIVLPTTSNDNIVGTWSPTTVSTFALGTQTYTFTPTDCYSPYSIDISIIVPPAPPTGAAVQNFNIGQTLADLVVNGDNLAWYSDSALTVSIPETTLLMNGTAYYVVQQVGACKSSGFGIIVTDCATLNIPTPTGDTNQTFTAGQTLADLVVNGDNLVWYSDNTYSNTLSLSEPLVNGATYYVRSENGNCQSDSLVITVVEEQASRSDFDIFGFSYYPNPVTDILTFSSNQPIDKVVVSNMLGQEVKANLSSDKTSLDMSNLANGNYLVKVTIEGVSKTIKVVKL